MADLGDREGDEKASGVDEGTSDFRSLSSGAAGETQARSSRSRVYAGDDDDTDSGQEMVSNTKEEVLQEGGPLACEEREVRAEQVRLTACALGEQRVSLFLILFQRASPGVVGSRGESLCFLLSSYRLITMLNIALNWLFLSIKDVFESCSALRHMNL